MAKFIKAPTDPEAPVAEPGPLDQAAAWLAAQGVETGLAGGALLAGGGLLALYGLAALGIAAHRRSAHETDGEVVETEPAMGGGHTPVVVYRDASGRARRFVSDMSMGSDPTGRRVRVRVVNGSPRIVRAGAGASAGLAGAIIALVLAGILVATGLTGRLAGVVALPWP